MSRPKVVTPEVTELVVEEASRRMARYTNKQFVRIVKKKTGVDLSVEYLGKLVAEEMRTQKVNYPSSDVSRGTTEITETCGTIRE